MAPLKEGPVSPEGPVLNEVPLIIVSYPLLDNIFLNAFALLMIFAIHSIRVQLGSQTYKFFDLFSFGFIFEHTDDFLVNSCFYVRGMIDRVITRIKSCLDIFSNVFVKIFCLYFIR